MTPLALHLSPVVLFCFGVPLTLFATVGFAECLSAALNWWWKRQQRRPRGWKL